MSGSDLLKSQIEITFCVACIKTCVYRALFSKKCTFWPFPILCNERFFQLPLIVNYLKIQVLFLSNQGIFF